MPASRDSADVDRVVSRDGATFDVQVLRPRASTVARVLIVPALGVRASFYAPFAQACAEHGLAAYVMDLRGHGSSSVRPDRRTDFGFVDMVDLDVDAALEHVRRDARVPVCIVGHSLGGMLGLLHAATHRERADAAVTIASVNLNFRLWSGRMKSVLALASVLFPATAMLLGRFPGQRLGFGRTESRGTMRDWGRLARRGRFDLVGARYDYERALSELRMPVLNVSFSDDDWAPARPCEGLAEKLRAAERTRWHLAPGDLGAPAAGHFGWVQLGAALAPRLRDWIVANVRAPA